MRTPASKSLAHLITDLKLLILRTKKRKPSVERRFLHLHYGMVAAGRHEARSLIPRPGLCLLHHSREHPSINTLLSHEQLLCPRKCSRHEGSRINKKAESLFSWSLQSRGGERNKQQEL